MKIIYQNTLAFQDYIRLCESVGWPRPDAGQSETCLLHSDYLVSAIDTDTSTTIGMARCVGDSGMVAMIVDVVVQPEYQGNGVGTNMINNLVSRIKSNIGPGQKVMINLIAAKGRESFYKRFGFICHPNEDYGNGMYLWHFK